jgi:cob(I)alamin adenosyltransferase
MTRGYVQVYTGDGKGKTTAALGLIVRAVGAGLRVFCGHFLKGCSTAELQTLRTRFPDVTVRQFGRRCFVKGPPSAQDKRKAVRGLEETRRAMASGRYDIVIADEANAAVAVGLFGIGDLMRLVEEKPAGVELVITGRRAHPRLIRRADLVTVMKCRKHYYDRGVKARKGIEC